MAVKIVMPRLSLTMKTGSVVRWYKGEGDKVEKGEPIVEVLTEKVTYDIEAPESGILRKIYAKEGDEVPVNGLLAIITKPDEPLPEIEVEKEKPKVGVKKRVLASPAAKRLAREHGIDLTQIVGTGPEGRIIEADVRRYIEEKLKYKPKVREVIPLTGIKKVSAERVARSTREAPHCTLCMEVDMTQTARLKETLDVSYTDIIVKAVAHALKEHRILNSTLEGDKIKVFEEINIGVATATPQGLVVPVVKNADKKSLSEISAEIKALAKKAREGKLEQNDVLGGTFTVTNLGMYGVEFFTPIINPPEAAILGVGKIVQKPVVEENEVKVKPMMMLSLSFDHRIVDGAPAAQFLARIKEILENPSVLSG
ncbi:2-oxo acid dehydrogenase subunit E2 [Candidatus Bathyarchaeota archaeon]|nr:MAG: 2-oxo acid dehydrogenase subunit E2 [Candidatus Bathyarchaeota archaeon]